MVTSGAMATQTAVEQAQLAREQERQVLAEGSFAGEKRVGVARLFVFGLMAVIGGKGPHHSMGVVVFLLYGLFAALALWAMHSRLARPSWNRAKYFQYLFPTIDFSFLTLRGWALLRLGQWTPEISAAPAALVLCFSLLRPQASIFYSTLLALAACVVPAYFNGTATSFGTLTVIAAFLALGLLLWRSNVALGQMFLSLRRRDNLSRFLPSQLVEKLLGEGEAALRPVQREVSVLFLDVRDFTAMSEQLQPHEVLEFLDDLLGRMSRIVKGHDGIVNQFLGDGMLAFWGVPTPREDHATAALRAALDMRRELEDLNGLRARQGKPPVRIGIGIHTGVVAAGMLGGAEQHEYTVIGDAVNLASRIEGLTKKLGVDILISNRAWERAGPRFVGARHADEKVKGREETVVVWALEGLATQVGSAAGSPAK